MAVLHVGTATTLATVPKADCSNNDTANIWLNRRSVQMVYDSTATNATYITDGATTPYYIRPNDYGAGPGVWIENAGAIEENIRLPGDHIIGSQLTSTNWAATAGSEYDLDNAKFRLGGSNVDAAGSAAGIFMGLDSAAYKFYIGDGSNKYIKFDATDITINLTNLILDSSTQTIKLGTGNDIISLDATDATYRLAIGHATYASAPFRVTKAGALTASSATISGAITATSGSITGDIIVSGAIYSTGKTTYADTDAGFWLGNDSGTYKFNIGDANSYMKWDGSSLTMNVKANVGTGVGVVYKGGSRWLYDFNPAHNGTLQPDGYNTFLGVECGNLTMGSTSTANVIGSSYNVGVGYQTLYTITTGYQNVGIGYHPLYSLTSGYRNVAIGYECAKSIIGGYNNVAIGHSALGAITEGAANIAIGFDCMNSATGGATNIALGANTLGINSSGVANIAIMSSALQSNTSGDYNIGLGSSALYGNSTGSKNIAIGEQSGRYQNDGSSALQTPENSVYFGAGTKSGSDPAGGEDAITNEIVIGYNAIGNGSNTVKVGNTSISALHCQVALTVDSDERIKRNINPSLIGLAFINALNPITFQPENPFDYPDKIKPSNYKDRIIKEKDPNGKEISKLVKAEPRPLDNDKTYLGLTAQQVEQAMSAQGIDLELVSTSNQGKKAITYGSLLMPMITAIQELSAKITNLEKTL